MTRQADHHDQTETLRARLAEAEEMLRAIRQGEIDALVVEGAGGNQVYTLHSAEEPYRNLVEQMQEGAVVLTGRGDILYSNARFAALVGEPLESVVGSRIDRFVHCSDRDDVETLLRAGSGRRRSRLIGSGCRRLRGESVAYHHGVDERRSPESDRDRSPRAARGQQQPRPRRARQPHERRVPGDAGPRAAQSARRDQQCGPRARVDARRGGTRAARARGDRAANRPHLTVWSTICSTSSAWRPERSG